MNLNNQNAFKSEPLAVMIFALKKFYNFKKFNP